MKNKPISPKGREIQPDKINLPTWFWYGFFYAIGAITGFIIGVVIQQGINNDIIDFTGYRIVPGLIEKCEAKTVVTSDFMLLPHSEQVKILLND